MFFNNSLNAASVNPFVESVCDFAGNIALQHSDGVKVEFLSFEKELETVLQDTSLLTKELASFVEKQSSAEFLQSLLDFQNKATEYLDFMQSLVEQLPEGACSRISLEEFCRVNNSAVDIINTKGELEEVFIFDHIKTLYTKMAESAQGLTVCRDTKGSRSIESIDGSVGYIFKDSDSNLLPALPELSKSDYNLSFRTLQAQILTKFNQLTQLYDETQGQAPKRDLNAQDIIRLQSMRKLAEEICAYDDEVEQFFGMSCLLDNNRQLLSDMVKTLNSPTPSIHIAKEAYSLLRTVVIGDK